MDVRNPTLALTYKDDGNQDGICSQLLRIYGVYAISRFLRVPYVHSPIAHLGYHGLTALENNGPLPNLLADVNRVFQIPSDIELPDKRVTIHDMIDADIESIERIGNAGSNGRDLHLIRILYPFPVTDSKPELYRCLETVCPFPYRRSEVFRLAIHVRRGECFAVATDWLLPNSYYVQCVLRFQEILRKLDIPFVCELYTEVPSKPFEVTPEHHGIGGRITENVIFDPAMNHIEDFDAIPKLERFINFDPIESLRRMATADALIMSHSSFSYLPAIFNPNCIVVYHPYWRGRMKDWLVSDDDGGFTESDLAERLRAWKRAGDRDSSAAARERQRLLQPFREQSFAIRSVAAMGLEIAEETDPLRLVIDEDSFRPIIRLPSIESPGYALDRLARQARGLSRTPVGDDLLLLPAHLLNETMTSSAEEFSFRAVAVLFTEASGGSADNWKLRRSLFDRGLVCIGSVDFAGGQAFCFLASDAVRSFNQLDVESRGHITISSFLEGAGFGNQLWRYACVKLYALRHGLTPALPAWQGSELFGLEDKSCEDLAFPRIRYPGFADNDRELWDRDDPPIDIDLAGYFQEIPKCWRKHRALLRHMFQPSPAHVRTIDDWRNVVTDGGRRTLVAISVRRGDYYKFQVGSLPWFRIVPEEWYLDWLRTIWPTLSDPVLFVTSDEPEKTVPLFQEFKPIPAAFGSGASALPRHIRDFEVLRRADYLAICNSSFPRFAAILAPSTQKCFLPSFQTQSFLPYQPWMDPAFWARFAKAWSGDVSGEEQRPAISAEQPAFYFDVSDLMLSLPHQTGLSGIQRIQWEILRNVVDIVSPMPVRFAVMNKGGGHGTIAAEALIDVIEHLRTGAAAGGYIESEVRNVLNEAVPCSIRSRDVFLAIGAFWNVSGMGAALQSMKNAGAVIGVFIHDMIPIVAPELFEPAGAHLFVKGVAEALTFADFVLTSSEYNKAALHRHMGSALDSLPVQVVPLGNKLSLPAVGELRISDAITEILETGYVLCAATIDAPNNPAYLLNIWKMMMRSARRNTPRLVFAGRKGWCVEDFMRQLDASNYLDGRILVISDATDAELDSLYQNCILTVFPAFVEGLSLPVGESLGYGKICMCSSEQRAPEAGGMLVDYMDPYNARDGLAKILRYLDNPELRRSREVEISEHFKPRSWKDAAVDFLRSTDVLSRHARPFEGVAAILLPPGRYLPIGSDARADWKDQMDGRMSVELICVSGWHPPETSGVRAALPTAAIRFRADAPAGARINLAVRLAAQDRGFRIRIRNGSGAEAELSLAAGSEGLLVLPCVVEPGNSVNAQLLSMGARLTGEELPCASWMLKGILYFEPKRVVNESSQKGWPALILPV